MCGIAGVVAFTEAGKQFLTNIDDAVQCLHQRGPDHSGVFRSGNVALGHTRLAIIDTSDAAAQPMSDPSGRYTINFNGEIFNFRELRNDLHSSGVDLKSNSDTEVLLHLYIREGPGCLQKLNGFFAFSIYDMVEKKLFIARDRMGIKPVMIYHDFDKLIYASEMKAMMKLGIPTVLDEVSFFTYLQLNYIPPPWTIFKDVYKLKPGTYMLACEDGYVSHHTYYSISTAGKFSGNYDQAQQKLFNLLDESVSKRLIADVPLGAFLSGGIDSSIIVALASSHTSHLNTFSIGFKDEPMYDETRYSKLVADKYDTNHTVFSLSSNDLYEHLHNVLDYIDEPFADSSAIAVNILSRETQKHVKVALSGDGADEIFAGYNKHRAEYLAQKNSFATSLVKLSAPAWSILPKSRNNPLKNKIRQLHRFASTASLPVNERYWQWACITGYDDVFKLRKTHKSLLEYNNRKELILNSLKENNFNSVLLTDMQLVLQGDMLTKVDMMSMANSLEVRVPFLDYRVVDFAFSLPPEYKIDDKMQKKILLDTFGKLLPAELRDRKKHGFEVPLLKWFRNELKSTITDDLLSDEFIHSQGLFEPEQINKLKMKLFSPDPGDVPARIWGLIVFQYWWKKYMN